MGRALPYLLSLATSIETKASFDLGRGERLRLLRVGLGDRACRIGRVEVRGAMLNSEKWIGMFSLMGCDCRL